MDRTRAFIPIALALLFFSTHLQAGEKFTRPDPVISYSGPEDPKVKDPARFVFQEWKPGQVLSLAVHDANLRAAPNAKADVVKTLPMGTRVVVREAVGEPVFIIGKRDRWYRVAVLQEGLPTAIEGHLFGMILTPAAFEVDLDGDGELELVTVAFASNFKIRVRIREPGVAEPDHLSVDVDAAGGAYVSQRGGLARVAVEDRGKSGVGLVSVHAYVEACADFATHWISYEVPGGKKGVLGEAKLALSLGGVSDPPVHSDFEVTFTAKPQGATVVRTNSEEDEDGKERVEKTTSRYVYRDGVYHEQQKKDP